MVCDEEEEGGEGESGIGGLEETYEAKNDRGFAHGSLAWVMGPVSRRERGGEGGSGWQVALRGH